MAVDFNFTLEGSGKYSANVEDANGVVVRQLINAEETDGGNLTVTWDGEDNFGNPRANQSSHKLRVVRFPGFKAKWLMDLSNDLPIGTQNQSNPWWEQGAAVHHSCRSLAIDETGIYINGMTENLCAGGKFTRDMKTRIWSNDWPEVWESAMSMCVVGNNLYMLGNNGKIYVTPRSVGIPRATHAGGPHNPVAGSRRFQLDVSGMTLRNWGMPNRKQQLDLAGVGSINKLLVSLRDINKVRWMDTYGGNVVEADVNQPQGVAVMWTGEGLVCSGGEIKKVAQNGTVSDFISDGQDFYRIDCDWDTQMIYAYDEGTRQVYRYNGSGQRVQEYGAAGGRSYGRYVPTNFRGVCDLIATGDGFMVCEWEPPLRVAKFFTSGKMFREWRQGGPWINSAWGNPKFPSEVWYMSSSLHLVRARLNLKRRTYAVHSTYQLPGFPEGIITPRWGGLEGTYNMNGGQGEWQLKERNGDLFLFRREFPSVARYDPKTQSFKLCAEIWWKEPGNSYVWTDPGRTGVRHEADKVYHNNGAYDNERKAAQCGWENDDFSFYYLDDTQRRIYRIPCTGFNAAGNPTYGTSAEYLPTQFVHDPNLGGKIKHYHTPNDGKTACTFQVTADRVYCLSQTHYVGDGTPQDPEDAWGRSRFCEIQIGLKDQNKLIARAGKTAGPRNESAHWIHPPKGTQYCVKTMQGAPYNCIWAQDFNGGFDGYGPAMSYVYDKFGLYLGGCLDDYDTSEGQRAYQYTQSTDNGSSGYMETADGELLHYACNDTAVRIIQITGWQGGNWERHLVNAA